MIVGSIGYEVHSGLGHLMRDFYTHGVVQRVFPIRHGHYQNYPGEWFKPQDRYTKEHLFLDGLDVLLLFENAFRWRLVQKAKDIGVKVVLIPNYEYTPFPIPVVPDLVLCGSLLDMDYYCNDYATCFLNVPVDTRRFPWRLREKAINFIHNAGHGQRGFAKGTPELISAMEYVTSPVTLTVRGQPGEKRIKQLFAKESKNPKIKLELEELDESQLYTDGDVFINAEQYNGLSLPLQEAFASGMLIMSTHRYPMNTWLPNAPLITPHHYVPDKIAVKFDRAIIFPEEIASKIDDWYAKDITKYSLQGKTWAEEHSWETLKPIYLGTLASCP